MINQLAEYLREALAKQRYPAGVVYGAHFTASPETYPNGLIQLVRDSDASDALEPPQGSRHAPEYRGVRLVAAKATIYAQSSLDGAQPEEHEDLCEAYVDAFLIAVAEWCSVTQRGSNPFRLGTMRYLKPEERNQELVWPGVVYQIQFSINRAVVKRAFDGETRATFAFEGSRRIIANQTNLSYPGRDPNAPPETNCGG